jgi:hypothetical protein
MPLHIFLGGVLAASFDYPESACYHGAVGECVRGLVGVPADGAGPARWAAGIIAAVVHLDGLRAVGTGLAGLADFALDGVAVEAAGDLAARERAVARALAGYTSLADAAPASRLVAARALLAEVQALVALLEGFVTAVLVWLPLERMGVTDLVPWL